MPFPHKLLPCFYLGRVKYCRVHGVQHRRSTTAVPLKWLADNILVGEYLKCLFQTVDGPELANALYRLILPE